MNLNDFELLIHKRVEFGSKAARKARYEGKVPVNFYGLGHSFSGYMDLLDLQRALKTKTLFNMFSYANFDGQKFLVVAKILQRDSVSEAILHVDFQIVDPHTSFKMRVPISYINQDLCNDIKLGSVLNIVSSTLVLKGVPSKMPSYLMCDLSSAKAKVPIRLSSVFIPDGISLVGAKLTDTIASISAIKRKGADSDASASVSSASKK